jgi:hypothetical protein
MKDVKQITYRDLVKSSLTRTGVDRLKKDIRFLRGNLGNYFMRYLGRIKGRGGNVL